MDAVLLQLEAGKLLAYQTPPFVVAEGAQVCAAGVFVVEGFHVEALAVEAELQLFVVHGLVADDVRHIEHISHADGHVLHVYAGSHI